MAPRRALARQEEEVADQAGVSRRWPRVASVRAASSTIGRCPLLEPRRRKAEGGQSLSHESWQAQLEISWHVGVSVACTSRPLDYFGSRDSPGLCPFLPPWSLQSCNASESQCLTAVTLSASAVGTHDPLVALCGGRRPRCTHMVSERPRCTHMVSERDGDAGCAHTATQAASTEIERHSALCLRRNERHTCVASLGRPRRVSAGQ